MNRQLSTSEIDALLQPISPAVMTRKDKLLWLAMLIRTSHRPCFYLFHLLEEESDSGLMKQRHPMSAFAMAAADPTFKAAGLKGDNAWLAKQFFELTKDELHDFSCNCTGELDNEMMARRIEAIALGTRVPHQPR